MPRLLPKTAANRGPRGLCASMRARRAGLVVAACLSILPAAPVAAETPAASPQQQGRPLESTESVYRHVLKMTGLDARRPNQDEFIGAVSDAVRSHPSSRGNLLNRDIAEQGIKAARSDLFPSVNIGLESVGSSFGRVGKHQYSDFAVRPDAFLTVQQLIYDGGAVYKRIAAARYNATAVQATTAAQTHSFALQTISVYYDVVRLRAIVEMARENVRRYEELYGQVRERAEGGLIPPSDMLQAESRLADARARLIGFLAQYQQVVASFVELFGRQPENVGLPVINIPVPTSPDEVMDRAFGQNPTLVARQFGIATSRAEYDALRASDFPRIGFSVQGSKYDVSNLRKPDYGVDVRVGVTMNLYSGGLITARQEQARQRVTEAELQFDSTRLELERRVKSALVDLSSLGERLDAEAITVRTYAATADAYREMFIIGRRGLSDIVSVERDLFDAQRQFIDNLVDLELSRLVIVSLTGDLLTFLGLDDIALRAPGDRMPRERM